jgi:hypothetical protein
MSALALVRGRSHASVRGGLPVSAGLTPECRTFAPAVDHGDETTTQAPSWQMEPKAHATPQSPQWFAENAVLTQLPPQDFDCASQSHLPSVHASFALQATPHDPQCRASESSDTQAPRQAVFPASQPHVPPLHCCVAGHA